MKGKYDLGLTISYKYSMGKTLKEIAQELKEDKKKVQIIYAFNGTGKTRLSKEFACLIDDFKLYEYIDKSETLVDLKNYDDLIKKRLLYYNAFTEDLFYWDNHFMECSEPKLKIQPNDFTNFIFQEQGQDGNVIKKFQNYTNDKLTPRFNPDFSEITFSYERGNEERSDNIKISKGEESCFIWSVFYTLLEQAIENLNIDKDDLDHERETDKFDDLEYIFIDDPVTSLDENHLIELAVDLSDLIKSSKSDLKFIITTHNSLFYNVIFNELNKKKCYMLSKLDDASFEFININGDANKRFSYHLFLIQTIKEAIETNNIQKYHFMLLRNLYEKTASFLGYPEWKELLPEDKQTYYHRIIQFTSHSTLSNEVVAEPTEPEKRTVKILLEYIINKKYWVEEKND